MISTMCRSYIKENFFKNSFLHDIYNCILFSTMINKLFEHKNIINAFLDIFTSGEEFSFVMFVVRGYVQKAINNDTSDRVNCERLIPCSCQ